MTHEIDASEWINASGEMSLAGLRGRVVMVTAFQMLCQGCVTTSVPQARSVHAAFSREDLMVIGLHSVFEHHAVMTPAALRVFAHESRLPFPIAVDRPRDGLAVPATMSAWSLEGTPTLMLFDRDGQLAVRHFGHIDDLRLGALLGGLINRPTSTSVHSGTRQGTPRPAGLRSSASSPT
jgi:hypothetical protein